MKTPRFFYSDILAPHHTVMLDAETSHRLLHVQRLKLGQEIILFNGDGKEYLGHLVEVQKKCVRIAIEQVHDCQSESPLFIEIGQAISRHEKMDYAIQKSVELGVMRITPLLTERCTVQFQQERKQNRLAHWKNIIIHACEQSGRVRMPALAEPMALSDWLAQKRDGLCLVCDPDATAKLCNLGDKKEKITHAAVLIGPEGGLTSSEIAQAVAAGFNRLSLGPRILRTETATVVALTVLQNRLGDLASK